MPLKDNFAALVFVKTPALFIVPATAVSVELLLSNVFENVLLAVNVNVPLIYPFGALASKMRVVFAPVVPIFKLLPASIAKSLPLPPAMVKVVEPDDCKLILVFE